MFLGNGLDVDVRHGIGRGGVVGSDHTSPSGWPVIVSRVSIDPTCPAVTPSLLSAV